MNSDRIESDQNEYVFFNEALLVQLLHALTTKLGWRQDQTVQTMDDPLDSIRKNQIKKDYG